MSVQHRSRNKVVQNPTVCPTEKVTANCHSLTDTTNIHSYDQGKNSWLCTLNTHTHTHSAVCVCRLALTESQKPLTASVIHLDQSFEPALMSVHSIEQETRFYCLSDSHGFIFKDLWTRLTLDSSQSDVEVHSLRLFKSRSQRTGQQPIKLLLIQQRLQLLKTWSELQ